MNSIKVIAFDADDTLWVNEPLFQETERKFCELLEDFLPHHNISKELFKIEMKNLPIYGYGAKAFMLSMIETAVEITNGSINIKVIDKIIALGKELLNKPVENISGVEEILDSLKGKYKLVVATKGDLLDQEKKLKKSGLSSYFHHTEIVSDKNEVEYSKLIKHLDIMPDEFLMVGNSLKSDVIPVLNIGAYAFHVPYHTTWEHEKIEVKIDNEKFRELESIRDVIKYIR